MPYPLPSSPCRIRAIGAPLLASSIGSKPPCFGVKPHAHWVKLPLRSLPCSNHHLKSKASEATLHATGQTPSLAMGYRCTSTALHHSTQLCVPQASRHSGAIIISSGASTHWQIDRRGIDRRHPGPMRRGTNSQEWSMGVQRAAMDYGCSPG